MNAYSYISEFWQDRNSATFKKLRFDRLIKWRREPSVIRIDRPTRLDRARALGYKAKKGYVLARVSVNRGGRRKSRPRMGRRSKRMGVSKLTAKKSRQRIAEERCNKKFKNLEVLNSYPVLSDGRKHWFEVILVDPKRPEIQNDQRIKWITNKNKRGRVYRGKTSAGKKGRGLRKKGKGAEHLRPSYDR
jgi:large subunit ribosomal protein L15e